MDWMGHREIILKNYLLCVIEPSECDRVLCSLEPQSVVCIGYIRQGVVSSLDTYD